MNPLKKQPNRLMPWYLGSIVLILLTMLILLQSSNLWRTFSVESATDTFIFYGLISLNTIAFIVFAFIFIRNIVKLMHERRAFQLGSKIKTRLLTYFIAVNLLPIFAMAVFSFLFMNRALERWFTQIPENAVRGMQEAQEKAVENQIAKLGETAQMLAAVFQAEEISVPKLNEIADRGNLKLIAAVSNSGQIEIQNSVNLSDAEKAAVNQTLLRLAQNNFKTPVLSGENDFDAAAARISDGRFLVIFPNLQIRESVTRVAQDSLEQFDALKERQMSVRQIGFSTLGLLTFLLIFASSWTAFYLARGFTVPIKALAEGADELAQGNYKYRVNVLAEDELALLVNSFNQMSERLESNSAELRERRRYIETVLQSLPTGVISLDSQNRVTTINNAALEMLKLENTDYGNTVLEKLVGEENRAILEKVVNRAKRIGQASEQTSLKREKIEENDSKNEAVMPVALTATALPDKNGAVLVIEDLTELLQAQRASAWSEVARRMAHEIKNPLTPIQLSAERIAKRFKPQVLAEEDFERNHETKSAAANDLIFGIQNSVQTQKLVREGTDTILREVASLKAMVDEFSRFARLPNVKLEAGDLNPIIRRAADLFEDRGAKINIDSAENLPEVLLDEEQIKRVFVNLIQNAFESFDETQNEIIISLKTFYDAGRDAVICEVSDNGSGIPPADFQKLFQPYFSTKGRGTGLGLAIVQRIVVEHGGKIKAVNNSPKGAKFIVELPTVV